MGRKGNGERDRGGNEKWEEIRMRNQIKWDNWKWEMERNGMDGNRE